MSRTNLLSSCRRPNVQTWVGVLLVALLVLAEAFATAHAYDSAAHTNGQACAVCVGAASFGAAAAPTAVEFDAVVATMAVVVVPVALVLAVVPTRRYARGPPAVSFTF